MPVEYDTAGAFGGNLTFGRANRAAITGAAGGSVERGARLNTAFAATGSWYWELWVPLSTTSPKVIGAGITKAAVFAAGWYNTADGCMYYGNNGNKYSSGANSAYGQNWPAGSIIGVHLENGSIFFYKNGIIQNSGTAAYTGLTGNFYPAVYMYSANDTAHIVVSENELWYPLPAGASALEAGGSTLPKADTVTAVATRHPYSGLGYIAGTLTINGAAAEGYVTLRVRRSGFAVETQWAVGGSYVFTNLDPTLEYDVIARDPLRGYKDYIEPAVVPVT